MSESSSTPMEGGCLCGAIRYVCKGTPVLEGNCHCRDCQKSSGGPYAPTLFFPVNSIEIRGDVKYFESIGGSGQPIRRGFCPNCGSQLFGRPALRAAMIGVRAGTLDDPSRFHPQADIFTSHATPWGLMLEHTAKFEIAPPPP